MPVNHRSVRDGKFSSRELSDQIYYDTFIRRLLTQMNSRNGFGLMRSSRAENIFYRRKFLTAISVVRRQQFPQAHISTISPSSLPSL